MLDFVDEDILEKLAALDELEQETDLTLTDLDAGLEAAQLTPQEAAIIKAIRDRQLLARERSNRQSARRNAPLPRAVQMRSEPAPPPDTVRGRARSAAEKRGRSVSRKPDDAMDTSVERSKSRALLPAKKKARRDASRAASAHRSSSRPAPRTEQGLTEGGQDLARTLLKKSQRKMNRMARAGESDRKTGPKLIRWMNEGKRSNGTANHR